jgi:hypothetical protein
MSRNQSDVERLSEEDEGWAELWMRSDIPAKKYYNRCIGG